MSDHITTLPKWNGDNYLGERYDDYCVLFSHHRDSDILVESNWRSIIKHLDKNPHIKYQVVRSSHWAVGWIEQILIEEHDIASICFGELIQQKLKGYPIFNEEDYSELEWEHLQEIVRMIEKDIQNLDDDEQLKGWEPVKKGMTTEQICDIVYEHGWAQE